MPKRNVRSTLTYTPAKAARRSVTTHDIHDSRIFKQSVCTVYHTMTSLLKNRVSAGRQFQRKWHFFFDFKIKSKPKSKQSSNQTKHKNRKKSVETKNSCFRLYPKQHSSTFRNNGKH